MCFMFLPCFVVGSNVRIQESNLQTLESHIDFNPFTFWLRYACTKHTGTVQSLLTTDYTFMNFALASQGVETTIQRRVSSWFTSYNPSSRKHVMHLRGLVFPPPHQLLFPPVIISVAITTHYSSDQPRLWTTTNEKCQQHKQRFESQAEVVISGSHQHLTVQVTGSVLSKALGCLCMEVMQPRKTFLSLAPCQPAVGGQDALPAPLWGRQLVLQLPHPSRPLGAAGADSHPHLSASSQTPKRKGKNQPHSLPQHCLGTPRALGCRERPPRVSPMHPLTARPGHGNPLLPPQRGGYGSGQSSRKQQLHLQQKYCAAFSP